MIRWKWQTKHQEVKQCNKPGSSSKPSLKELKKMQEDLKKEMNGKSGKDGEKGKKKGEKRI